MLKSSPVECSWRWIFYINALRRCVDPIPCPKLRPFRTPPPCCQKPRYSGTDFRAKTTLFYTEREEINVLGEHSLPKADGIITPSSSGTTLVNIPHWLLEPPAEQSPSSPQWRLISYTLNVLSSSSLNSYSPTAVFLPLKYSTCLEILLIVLFSGTTQPKEAWLLHVTSQSLD